MHDVNLYAETAKGIHTLSFDYTFSIPIYVSRKEHYFSQGMKTFSINLVFVEKHLKSIVDKLSVPAVHNVKKNNPNKMCQCVSLNSYYVNV